MKTHAPWGATLASLLALSACGAPEGVGPSAPLAITGPFQHENLQVWLVSGSDRPVSSHRVVPLQEALEQNLVVVHETGDVNELAIENVADDIDVYVQSGDIVQGGKQDRTISVDLVLAPNSGRVPLPSFCVEQGRWSPRIGGEAGGVGAASLFSYSSNSAPTPALKKAILLENDQSKVWEEVENTQMALFACIGDIGAVVDASSATSLELTMNTEAVKQATGPYCEALMDIVDRHDGAVGVAFVISGELHGGDVYGSRELFARVWPKLLRAAATAAVAVDSDAVETGSASQEDVQRMLAAALPKEFRGVGGAGCMGTVENPTNHVVESRVGGALLHRAYLTK